MADRTANGVIPPTVISVANDPFFQQITASQEGRDRTGRPEGACLASEAGHGSASGPGCRHGRLGCG